MLVGSDVGSLVDRRIRADLAIVDQTPKIMNVQVKYWRCRSKMQPHSFYREMKTCVHRQIVVLAI